MEGLRERKRERTRQTIAAAALDLFARHGFHATTIPQIAEAADVSPRTVSGYFPVKEDLAFPYAEVQMAEFERRLAERAPGETAADALRAWIHAVVERGMEPPRDLRRRREVIDADESLRARERHYMLRTQEVLARAFAIDLGLDAEAIEPRMAAAATITVFELLGRDVKPTDTRAALEALDRALVFIGGGIGALRQ